MKKYITNTITVLAVSIAVVGIIGSLLPREHVASETMIVKQPPEIIWEVITDFAAFPSWRSNVYHIEQLADRNSFQVWREFNEFNEITYQITKMIPPNTLVMSIADNKEFGGNWTYEITSVNDFSTIKITANSYVENPVFRFMAKFVIGYDTSIKTYLNDLKKKLEEA